MANSWTGQSGPAAEEHRASQPLESCLAAGAAFAYTRHMIAASLYVSGVAAWLHG
jgi:hypothetical protein